MIADLEGPWMITETAWHDLMQISRDPEQIKAALSYLDQYQMGNNERPPYEVYGSVAVIPCVGVFSQRSSWWSWRFNGDRVQFSMTHAIQNVAVKSIVLDIDSPGGTVAGAKALGDYVYNCRQYKKKIVAVANELCCSAALYPGTAAHELVITPAGRIGSLGVLQPRLDVTKMNAQNGIDWTFFKSGSHKTFNYPETPVTDLERSYQQGVVATYFTQFVGDIARNRGVTPEEATKLWGNAQVWIGQAAVDVGLADSVNTLDGVVAKLSGQPSVNVTEQGNPEDERTEPSGSQQSSSIRSPSPRHARTIVSRRRQ